MGKDGEGKGDGEQERRRGEGGGRVGGGAGGGGGAVSSNQDDIVFAVTLRSGVQMLGQTDCSLAAEKTPRNTWDSTLP